MDKLREIKAWWRKLPYSTREWAITGTIGVSMIVGALCFGTILGRILS